MKKGMLLIVLFLLSVVFVVADRETSTFSVGESFVFEDKNITVVQINDRSDKAVVCVNNVRGIIDEDTREVNDVYFEVRDADEDSVEIRMTYTCDGPECYCAPDDILCSNIKCVPQGEEVNETESIPEEVLDAERVRENVEPPVITVGRSVQETESSSAGWIVLFVLLILVLIVLGIVSLGKKKKES